MTGDDERRRIADRYRIDSVLGRGGMSVVYQGYDEHLDRAVAIKLLHPHGPTEDGGPGADEIRNARTRDRERFLREIRTTARLELPGTPAVYDAGSDGAAELWVVMQLLRGSTLEAVIDRTETADLALARACAVAAQIAAVLVDVHRVDVVHRDIKPANVMVADSGLVKVLDFGIAILRGSGALPRLTQVDRTVGTPAYMSPEQHLGRPVTAASDIYSLGCVLHELLTGDPPFLASDDMPLRAHHLQTPPPSIRGRREDVPAEIDDLAHRMLAKNEAERPTAEQVYEVLVPWCATPGAAVEQDPTRPFRRPLLTPPSRGADQEPHGPPLTEAEVDTLRVDVAALLDEGREREAVRRVDAAVHRGAADEYTTLRLRHCLAETLFAADELRRAAPLFVEVGREYRRFLGPVNPLSLDCDHDAGLAYAELGDHENALPRLRRFAEHAPSDDVERVVDAGIVLAAVLLAADDAAAGTATLHDVRRRAVDAYGTGSLQVRNVDRQIARLDDASPAPR